MTKCTIVPRKIILNRRARSMGNNRKPVYESSFEFVVRLAKSETGFGNRRSAQISGFVGFNNLASAIYDGQLVDK